MPLITLGLIVSVLALANGLLYLDRNNGSLFKNPLKLKANNFSNNSNNISNRNNPYFLNKRMEFISKKIEEMEKYLHNNKNNSNNSHSNNYDLYKKVERLADFKREAEIEIRAIRDHLEERDDAFKKKIVKEDKKLDKKIHALVFNTRKKK